MALSRPCSLSVLLAGCVICSGAMAAEPDWLDVSGFGRLVGGYLDGDDNLEYLEYQSGEVEFGSQSLLGLQFDAKVTDKLGVSAQFLAHTGENRESGIEWLYVNYQPTDALNLKAGKLRVPFFNFSDVIDVGYAYPWVTPPRQVYVDYLFSSYDGINAQYTVGIDDATVTLETYFGHFDDDITISGESNRVTVDDLRGLIVTGRRGPFALRLAYNEGDLNPNNADLESFRDILRAADFFQSAQSIEPKGRVSSVSMGFSYTTLDYFVESEWINVKGNSIIIPDIESIYITAGYNLNAFTLYANLAESRSDIKEGINEIPLGVFPLLDEFSFAFDQVFTGARRNQDDLTSAAVGLRWDFMPNMALKVEVERLWGEDSSRSFFASPAAVGQSNQATLYQVALEWVF